MTLSGGRLSIASKYTLIIGITLVVGMAIGALAVVVFQGLISEKERASFGIHGDTFSRSSSPSPDSDSTEQIDELEQFREIFKHESTTDQYTALYTALSRATVDELKEWWTQSKQIERKSHRETAQSAILRKFAKSSPQEALRYIDDAAIFETDALLKTVFSEWAVSYLEGAIEAVSTLSVPRRDIAIEAILKSRDDLSDSELRSIAIELGNEEMYLKIVSDSKASQSIAEPKQSWDTLLNDSVDDSLQLESLAKVAEAWYAQIGFEVLSHMLAVASTHRVRLLRPIVQLDPAGALDYVRGVEDDSDKQYLALAVAREWARTDARGALSAVSTIQPPTLASTLESRVATTWARWKPNGVIENIELISEDFRIHALEAAFSILAGKDPKGAIEKLSSVEHYVGNTSSIVRSILNIWSNQEPDAAADWVLNTYPKEDPQRRTLLMQVLRFLVDQDPSNAFEIAIAQPVSSDGFGLEFAVMQEITRNGDVDLAKKLLPQVRGENTKAYVCSLIGGAMVEQSKFDEALDFGQELSESEQHQYIESVLSAWARKDPKNLLATLEGLPSDSFKSTAAFHLVLNNEHKPVLTDDQIENAKTFLNTDHETHVKRLLER